MKIEGFGATIGRPFPKLSLCKRMKHATYTPMHRRLMAACLAIAFLLQPAAIAGVPCSVLSTIFPSVCCCKSHPDGSPTVGPERSCCAAPATDSAPAPERAVAVSAQDCGCHLVRADSAQPSDLLGVRPESSTDLARWLEGSVACAAFVALDADSTFEIEQRALPPAQGTSSSLPASGCARHLLVIRGTQAILCAYCIALL